MRIKALSQIGDRDPLVKDANVVVIESNGGTILGVAVSLGRGPDGREIVHVAHADDEDFNKILQELGFDRLTICEEFEETPPDKMIVLAR